MGMPLEKIMIFSAVMSAERIVKLLDSVIIRQPYFRVQICRERHGRG
jgi:hypothetical protein